MRKIIQALSFLALVNLFPVPAFAVVRDALKPLFQDAIHLAAHCKYKAADAKLSQAAAARNPSREETVLIGQVKRYVEAKQTDRLQCGGRQR